MNGQRRPHRSGVTKDDDSSPLPPDSRAGEALRMNVPPGHTPSINRAGSSIPSLIVFRNPTAPAPSTIR